MQHDEFMAKEAVCGVGLMLLLASLIGGSIWYGLYLLAQWVLS